MQLCHIISWVPQPAFFYRPKVFDSERVVFILSFVGHRRLQDTMYVFFLFCIAGERSALGRWITLPS